MFVYTKQDMLLDLEIILSTIILDLDVSKQYAEHHKRAFYMWVRSYDFHALVNSAFEIQQHLFVCIVLTVICTSSRGHAPGAHAAGAGVAVFSSSSADSRRRRRLGCVWNSSEIGGGAGPSI